MDIFHHYHHQVAQELFLGLKGSRRKKNWIEEYRI
jgi:hypothetical protein